MWFRHGRSLGGMFERVRGKQTDRRRTFAHFEANVGPICVLVISVGNSIDRDGDIPIVSVGGGGKTMVAVGIWGVCFFVCGIG
jgi:hypothetical protein